MISEFQGEYRWLSNFSKCDVIWNNLLFHSTENAYQAAKNDDVKWHKLCQQQEPWFIKKQSKTIGVRHDWDSVRVGIMTDLQIQKYNQEPYKTLLINTGSKIIQEGNNWGDRFWGGDVRTGQGKNTLGKIIMDIRNTLLNQTEKYTDQFDFGIE